MPDHALAAVSREHTRPHEASERTPSRTSAIAGNGSPVERIVVTPRARKPETEAWRGTGAFYPARRSLDLPLGILPFAGIWRKQGTGRQRLDNFRCMESSRAALGGRPFRVARSLLTQRVPRHRASQGAKKCQEKSPCS